MTGFPGGGPEVVLESFGADPAERSFRFAGVEKVVTACVPGEVLGVLAAVEAWVDDGGHAAGFLCYEAASALNPDLPRGKGGDLPLVWFGLFRSREDFPGGGDPAGDCRLEKFALGTAEEEFRRDIGAIREYIAAGETYQVNYTLRQRFRFEGDPRALYRRMLRRQRPPFGAWIDTGRHLVLSASPELFFRVRGDVIAMRPMKGTAGRSADPQEDRKRSLALARSGKDRAENLMIVDLIRNDLGRVAVPGSVEVASLFDVESYPTVHQMTSAVTARLRPGTGLTELLGALFPCGSVTGAPKRRTMEIIEELEDESRGVYCGAIGYLSPGGEAAFSVAIRTAVLDRESGTGVMGIGSGVVWDSEAESESRECRLKGAFLVEAAEPFRLVESMRWENGRCHLLDRHLGRLAASAAHFGFPSAPEALRHRLAAFAKGLSGPHKVRLLLAEDGSEEISGEPLAAPVAGALAVTVSACRVDSCDPLLRHKTTRRRLFEEERSRHPECADVIFLNERGEITEGSYNNIVLRRGGKLVTPAADCGLLPGTLRGEMLERGVIEEAVLTLDDLVAADGIWLINSVRGWRRVRFRSQSF